MPSFSTLISVEDSIKSVGSYFHFKVTESISDIRIMFYKQRFLGLVKFFRKLSNTMKNTEQQKPLLSQATIELTSAYVQHVKEQ